MRGNPFSIPPSVARFDCDQEAAMTDHEQLDPNGTLAICLMVVFILLLLIAIYAIARAV